MIEFMGIKMSVEALVFLLLFLADEILTLLPIPDNGFVDLFKRVVTILRPIRTEDDKIEQVVEVLKED